MLYRTSIYRRCDGRHSLEDVGSDSKAAPGYLLARARDAARVDPLLYSPKPIVPVPDIRPTFGSGKTSELNGTTGCQTER
jgi:hypothetical protein